MGDEPTAVWIPTGRGDLAGVVHLPAKLPAPVVVCCHGLMSSKNGTKFVSMGEALCRAGIAAVRFDFTGCGESRATHAQSLIGTRMRDLRAVLDFVRGQTWAGEPLGVMGSSFGGYLSLLTAAEARNGIQAVVCWAAPFDLRRVRLALEESSLLSSLSARGGRLGEPVSLEGLPSIPRVLVLHGQKDETVLWRDAVAIYRKLGEPRRLVLVKDAEHSFLDLECRRLGIRASLQWFQAHGMG